MVLASFARRALNAAASRRSARVPHRPVPQILSDEEARSILLGTVCNQLILSFLSGVTTLSLAFIYSLMGLRSSQWPNP